MKVGKLIDILNVITIDIEVYIDLSVDYPFNNKSLGSVTKEKVYGFVDVFTEAEQKNKTIVVLSQRPFAPAGGD